MTLCPETAARIAHDVIGTALQDMTHDDGTARQIKARIAALCWLASTSATTWFIILGAEQRTVLAMSGWVPIAERTITPEGRQVTRTARSKPCRYTISISIEVADHLQAVIDELETRDRWAGIPDPRVKHRWTP